MADMFSNFENQNEYYVPNNISQTLNKTQISNIQDEIKIFNIKGDVVGYKLKEQSNTSLPIDINPKIIVEKDALIYTTQGQFPIPETPGYVGKKAYNLQDCKSFICKSTNQIYNEWFEQQYFEYPTNLSILTGKEVRLIKYPNIESSTVEVTIMNYKYEQMFTIQVPGNDSIELTNIANDLEKGIYYCAISIIANDEIQSDLKSFQLVVE